MKKIKLKKRRNKLRFKRKLVLTSTLVLLFVLGIGYSFLSVNLNILGNITVKKSYGNTLYEVLEKEAAIGTYAQEYTGLHQDSMDASKSTEKIYHWYAFNYNSYWDSLAEEIIEKNNVLFANHCWQMIRTTDTGGVKLIYNGESENGQCLNTRSNHVGYSSRSMQNMSTSYYYGTDYTYDKTNKVFSLSGSITTGTIQQGQYTCMKTSATGTCSTLQLVDNLYEGNRYNTFSINGNTSYYQIGTTKFSDDFSSPGHLGYMKNTVYLSTGKSNYYSINEGTRTVSGGYYSDTIDYGNIVANKYTLINPQLVSSLSDMNDLVGKYVMFTSDSSDTVFYIVRAGTTPSYPYFRQLKNGDLDISLVYGDSYIDNGNGTYTINNPTSLNYTDWAINYTSYVNKYVCDGTSATCSNLKHIVTTSNGNYSYWGTDNLYKYSTSVSYSNGTYTLTGDIKEIWDVPISSELSTIETHHYTCFSSETTCQSVGYIYEYDRYIYHSVLNSVTDVSAALNNMLNDDNVNQESSVVKKVIDLWYKQHMLDYQASIEDTIFCNNRNITSLGGWSLSGNIIGNSSYLKFPNYSTSNTDISCTNNTDRFSLINTKAQLIYPVGLPSYSEMMLLGNNKIRETGYNYWTSSPYVFYHHLGYMRIINSTGSSSSCSVDDNFGVRPVISLRPGTEYISGTGSKDDPYVVNTFKDDDWDTIINNVRNGNTGNYQVGDTKTVDMGSLGTHTLRIVNKSTPSECNNSSFSQTACGFVLEFADVLSIQKMNSTSTNVGGWPATQLRTYINSDIYNALPSDLKNGIIDTIVVSGHGSSNSNNFTSTDKLYLQAVKELYGVNVSDSASNNTRQLDYYSNMGIHAANIKAARKYNSNYYYFWLISPNSSSTSNFYNVDSSGAWEGSTAATNNGVSPAFRIG